MIVSESLGRDLLRLIVWFPLRWIVVVLPPLKGVALFRLMGDLHYFFSSGMRRRLQKALKRIFPDISAEESTHVSREYFRNHYISQLLVIIYPRLSRKKLDSLVEFKGLEHLEHARKRGFGVVLVHGHYGPEQLALVGLVLLGYPVIQIGFPTDEGLSFIGRIVFRIRQNCEEAMPGAILKAEGDYRPVFEMLRNNGLVMTSGDGSGRKERLGLHAEFSFLGYPVQFPLGPARIALRNKASLLPCFVVRGEATPYQVVIAPAIKLDGLNQVESCMKSSAEGYVKDDDQKYMTRAFVEKYEQIVFADPSMMRFLDIFEPGKLIDR